VLCGIIQDGYYMKWTKRLVRGFLDGDEEDDEIETV
jgi:hypothetical protein